MYVPGGERWRLLDRGAAEAGALGGARRAGTRGGTRGGGVREGGAAGLQRAGGPPILGSLTRLKKAICATKTTALAAAPPHAASTPAA